MRSTTLPYQNRKMRMRILIALVMAAAMVGCATRPPEKPRIRASMGDIVLIVDYQVPVDSKAEFERFLMEVLMPAFEEYYPEGEQPVRLWTSTEPPEDGMFLYRFVLDPVNDYYPFDIEAILKGVYREDGPAYAEQFESFVEGGDEAEFQQTQW